MKEDIKKLADDFSRFVNKHHGHDFTELAGEMAGDHRTLVQAKMTVFIEFCKVLNEEYKAGRYDLRNEDSCKLANKIVEGIGDIYLRFI